ncbi:MAG: polymer-forming cytoskeletal protein [Acidobacteria bacterium]|nr:polymer-forming cytoskeletal protein [Acidobacteriota bacterium]
MFRVGKSNKPEPAEQPQQPPPRPAPAQPPQTQPSTGQPPRPAETQAARPAPVGIPAPSADDTVERARAAQAQETRAQADATARAVSETDALARGIKEGGVGGFVGGTSELSGEVRFRGMMRVDGHISGRIVSEDGTLIVSSGGRVDAEVSVAVARINGTVAGDITATEKIELGRTARVAGDLQTPALVVEQGAIFDGGCRMTVAEASAARSKNAA